MTEMDSSLKKSMQPELIEAALAACGEGRSQLASGATTESRFADYDDQFNLNDIGLAMRLNTNCSMA